VKNRFDGDLGMVQLNFDKVSNGYILGRQKPAAQKKTEPAKQSDDETENSLEGGGENLT